MVFPWHQVHIPDELTRTFKDSGLEMYRREVRDRASLLRKLGYAKDDAKARCRQNLEWEYQLHGKAPILDEISKLVDEVYGRA